MNHRIRCNQAPHRNRVRRFVRTVLSYTPILGLVNPPKFKKYGISVFIRVKNEADWIQSSILSIKDLADEIVVVDNGSDDGTQDIVRMLQKEKGLPIFFYEQPQLNLLDLSNFALERTRFHWVVKWDGDMVAHTTGKFTSSELRKRILSLDKRRYYAIYLRHINLAGDLFHQETNKQVHIEEYIYTYSDKIKFVHIKQFEAIQFPKYYKPLFWYEPYSFHISVKSSRHMFIIDSFLGEWLETRSYKKFNRIEDFVTSKIGTNWNEAEKSFMINFCKNLVPYNQNLFGNYPELLKPYLKNPKYKLIYQNGKIVGRSDVL